MKINNPVEPSLFWRFCRDHISLRYKPRHTHFITRCIHTHTLQVQYLWVMAQSFSSSLSTVVEKQVVSHKFNLKTSLIWMHITDVCAPLYIRCPSQLLQRSAYDSNHKVIANVCRAQCLHALPWNFKWAMTTSPVCVHTLKDNRHTSRIQMPDMRWSLHTTQPMAGVHIYDAPKIHKQKQQSLCFCSDQIRYLFRVSAQLISYIKKQKQNLHSNKLSRYFVALQVKLN